MKAGIYTIIVFLLGLGSALAQGVGIEAGANFNSIRGTALGGDISSAVRPGLRIGIVADQGLSDRLSFQYGGFYSARSSRTRFSSSFDDAGTSVDQHTDAFIRVNYVEVPLSLLYNISTARHRKFFFGGGPYMAMAFSGFVDMSRKFDRSGTITELSMVYPVSLGDEKTNDFNFFDAGLQAQLGYEIAKGFYARAHASYGVVDINPSEVNMKNAGFGLTIGYMIR